MLSVRGAGVVGINLLRRRILIQGNETMKQIFASEVVTVAAIIVLEVVAERGVGKFLGEKIDFVQEENLYQAISKQ